MTTVRQAIIEVLQTAGRPLPVQEITQQVLLMATNLKGKTPQHTVNSVLSTCSRFKRVSKGVYALSEWPEYEEFRKVTDIAYDILSEAGHPLAIPEITDQVVRERHMAPGSKNMIKQLLQKDSRFAQVAPGLFGLAQDCEGNQNKVGRKKS